jgi:hypothetical protein
MEVGHMMACLLAGIRTNQVEMWEEMTAGHEELMAVVEAGQDGNQPRKDDGQDGLPARENGGLFRKDGGKSIRNIVCSSA